MNVNDNATLGVWLSRGVGAVTRQTSGVAFDVVLGGDLAAAEAEEEVRREEVEARHRATVAELCDALNLTDDERASVTAYRGAGNPDALAFLVGGKVAAMVAGESDETGNHPVTVAEAWRHRLRGAP